MPSTSKTDENIEYSSSEMVESCDTIVKLLALNSKKLGKDRVLLLWKRTAKERYEKYYKSDMGTHEILQIFKYLGEPYAPELVSIFK